MDTTLYSYLQKALSDLKISDISFTLEHPADRSHGDFATNIALVAAKQVGTDPRELAQSIKEQLDGQLPEVAEITIAGPGFINFYLTREFLSQAINQAVEMERDWGCAEQPADKKVVVEYTSPNLFKPMHVGNLVGNIIGEAIARLHECAGHTVYRVNYPSDIGPTVAKGVWGIKQTGGDLDNIDDIGKAYVVGNTAYEEDGEAKKEIEAINRTLYAGTDPELNEIRERGIQTSKTGISKLLTILGTSFDAEFYESEAGPVGTTIVQDNIGEVFAESEGAVVYQGERVGLHTRVFLNSQGLPTYEAKDLGNFKLKAEKYPDYDSSLIVTGNEQKEYFKVLFAAIREVFPDAQDKELEHIATGFLTLTTGKMSSRTGNVLTGESLLSDLRQEASKRAEETRVEDVSELADMIAVAALKYQILRQKVGSDITFDKQQAFSFEGDSGPYLQYTHARIASVLQKASEAGIEISAANPPEKPYEIERLLYQFPEVLEHALVEKSPHHVLGFLTELTSSFNTFYAQEKIVDTTDEYAPYKLMIAKAVQQTLVNGLWVLGMKAPDRM